MNKTTNNIESSPTSLLTTDEAWKCTVWDLTVICIIIIAGLAVRISFFTGIAMGDDIIYTAQVLSLAHGSTPTLEQTHWTTRTGMTLLPSAILKTTGNIQLSLVSIPLFFSTLKIIVAIIGGNILLGRRYGILSGIIMATFPLEVIYATHFFPDIPVSCLSSLSLLFWIHALKTDSRISYLLTGLCFGLGYLFRETILLDGPVYITLLLTSGRIVRPKILIATIAPLTTLAAESLLFKFYYGDPFYRIDSILRTQEDPSNLTLISTSTAGGGFITDPLLMILLSHEFSIFIAASIGLAFFSIRIRKTSPFAIWLIFGFIWQYYGTTVPTDWVPLQRDPRYSAGLAIPAAFILSYHISNIRIPFLRYSIITALCTSGLVCASFDNGGSALAAHREFLSKEPPGPVASEPYEFVALLWINNSVNPPPGVSPGTALGRSSILRSVTEIPSVTATAPSSGDFILISPSRRPRLYKDLQGKGWIETESYQEHVPAGRLLAGKLLCLLPGQQQRAIDAMTPKRLVLLRRRATMTKKSQSSGQ
ncbi:glycosyltransferase family 39 protein [Thalassoglobus sp.]|uniref:glycosyltransferase family 39 protein n=1 Tax=Thalassoglobus sp. TaxID=2795869 RepID=UPI003AA9A2D7